MRNRRCLLTLLTFTLVTIGCHQKPSAGDVSLGATSSDTSGPNDAILTAIRAHLAHNSNLRQNSFDASIKDIHFDGNRAQAKVEFHARSGAGTMELTYALEKQDGGWHVIESTTDSSTFSHPAVGANSSMQPAGKSAAGSSSVFQTMDKLDVNSNGATTPGKQSQPVNASSKAAAPAANPHY
ncbi:MAG TPA: hypothetical protein VJN93_11610 [Candidatus Acidoferrum sp.]|nr:hypothetical protein [Candidatus Acidoferrum sp.]